MSICLTHVMFPGGWEAIYSQGRLITQGEDIDITDVFEEIEGEIIASARSEYRAVELAELGGHAPKQYSAIPHKE